ncbi:transglycosylase domain-containing protein [bacterium]|nr:transglycosylase domain-containing protein [bacterium]
MNRKLKTIIAAAFFLAVSAAAAVHAVEKISKGKIDGFSSRATELVKAKYGIDTELFGLDIAFFPPRIFLKKAVFSHSGRELAVLEECVLKDIGTILFSSEKKLDAACLKSRIHADKALSMHFPSDPEEKKNAQDKGRADHALSLHFTTDAEFIFGGITQNFTTDLTLSRSGGKVFFKEPESLGGGKAEVLFSLKERNASVRFDGIDLEDFREIIKNRTSFEISAGKISAFAEIKSENGKIRLKNDMTIRDFAFFHPLIDSLPFTLPLFRFKGDIAFDKNERSAGTKDAEVSLGGINAKLSAFYSKNRKEFSIKTESAKLNKLETLIHDAAFEGYLFGGTLELLAEYSQEGEEPPVFSVVGNLIDPKQLSERMDYLKRPFEYIWTNENGSERKIFVGERNYDFTPISLIPDHLIWAVVVSEDAGFFVHKGVDFQELDAAVKDNIKKHKLRGGSTITQQLAKNLFLNRDKTLLRKFREVLLAIELDAALSKERLLEIYFNIIEWAPGIFGISQASYYYFGKEPFQLTPLESAYLASVIPGPAKYHYMFLSKNVTENWYKSLYRILSIMNETGHLSTNDYFDALQQTIVFREAEED